MREATHVWSEFWFFFLEGTDARAISFEELLPELFYFV